MNAAMTRTKTRQAVHAPTIRKFRIVQTEGARQVERLVDHYRFEQRRRTAAELEAEEDAVEQLTETAKKLPTSQAPTGRPHTSPGQRPGSDSPKKSRALKGRDKGGKG